MIFAIAPLSAFAAESDGIATIIDITDTHNFYIDEDNYDPDGITVTGNNPNAELHIMVGAELTFRNVTIKNFNTMTDGTAPVVINLEGDNVMTDACISNSKTDIIINAEEGATLTATVGSYFINNGGWGGALTVNGGNITIKDKEGEDYPSSIIIVPYTQNGGEVSIIANNDYIFKYTVTLNGGSLSVSDKDKYVMENNKFTISSKASFKAVTEKEVLYLYKYYIAIAESEPENSYVFAKTSEDGEFVPLLNPDVLKGEKYIELKVAVHEHSFEDSDKCICGISSADYSGYDEAVARYSDITNEYGDKLTVEAKDYIRDKVQVLADKYLGNTDIKNNYAENEQYIVDGLAGGINEICDTLEDGIGNGTLIKPDYTEVEAKIAEFEKTHTGEEYAQLIAEIKADLAAIKEANPENHAEAADDIAAIEAKIEKTVNCDHMCHKDGIMCFFWKIINFFSKLFGLNPVCECGAAHY